MDLQELQRDIAASLWIAPGMLEELNKRKFLENINQYMLFKVLEIAKGKRWVYERHEKYYCYKNTVINILNPNGYELFIKTDTRSEFRKEFDRINGNI